jgi:hypothetical protein
VPPPSHLKERMLSKILMMMGWRRRPRGVGDLSINSRADFTVTL